jgi:hypothetical protein
MGGRLIYMRNLDVPGVTGHVRTVLGRDRWRMKRNPALKLAVTVEPGGGRRA